MTEIKINSKQDDPLLKQLKDSNVEVQGIKRPKNFFVFSLLLFNKKSFQGVLGVGGFGRVELVRICDSDIYLAQKVVSNTKIRKHQMELEIKIMQGGYGFK